MNYYFKFFFKRSYEKIIKELMKKRYFPEDSFFSGDIKDFIKKNFEVGYKRLVIDRDSNSFCFVDNDYLLNLKRIKKISEIPTSSLSKKDYNLFYKLNAIGNNDGLLLLDTYGNIDLIKRIYKKFNKTIECNDFEHSVVAISYSGVYNKPEIYLYHIHNYKSQLRGKRIVKLNDCDLVISDSRFLFEYEEELE